MAFRDENAWIPIEVDSNVVTRIAQTSAIEFAARRAPMATEYRNVPRSGGVGSTITARGVAYSNDTSTDDDVALQASKFAQGVPLTDEDLSDLSGVVDVIATRGADWAGSYAIHLDNACLGATGAVGTRETATPFTSVYYAVTHNDTGAGYTANANYASASTLTGSAGYSALVSAFNTYESSRWYSEDQSVVIAHPSFKKILRGLLDTSGRPVFVDTSGLTTVTGYQDKVSSRSVPSLFDTPILWSLGAKTAAVPSSAPAGNPLMIVGSRQNLILGTRSGPETKSERLPGQDTIELMFRSRRAFSVGFPQALSVLEYTGA